MRITLSSIAIALFAACVPDATQQTQTTATQTAAALPTVIAYNADWTPVIQKFDDVEMVLVPAGCFTMGNDAGRRDERPAQETCLRQSYWIDRTEVTNAEYGSEGHFSGANRPHENLLWSEARDFCATRSARLPTEAEWEYAARGPDSLIYPWGNDLIEDNLIFDHNTPEDTADVGSRPSGASWVGALDMSGNVFEWTSSIYARYPYDASDGREDPNDNTDSRVYRGGNQSYMDYGTAATTRFRLESTERDWFLGFRCARDVEG